MQETISIVWSTSSIDTYIFYKPLARYVDDIFIREQERKELVSARKTSYFSSQKKSFAFPSQNYSFYSTLKRKIRHPTSFIGRYF